MSSIMVVATIKFPKALIRTNRVFVHLSWPIQYGFDFKFMAICHERFGIFFRFHEDYFDFYDSMDW